MCNCVYQFFGKNWQLAARACSHSPYICDTVTTALPLPVVLDIRFGLRWAVAARRWTCLRRAAMTMVASIASGGRRQLSVLFFLFSFWGECDVLVMILWSGVGEGAVVAVNGADVLHNQPCNASENHSYNSELNILQHIWLSIKQKS